jgi:hypothetical protein
MDSVGGAQEYRRVHAATLCRGTDGIDVHRVGPYVGKLAWWVALREVACQPGPHLDRKAHSEGRAGSSTRHRTREIQAWHPSEI